MREGPEIAAFQYTHAKMQAALAKQVMRDDDDRFALRPRDDENLKKGRPVPVRLLPRQAGSRARLDGAHLTENTAANLEGLLGLDSSDVMGFSHAAMPFSEHTSAQASFAVSGKVSVAAVEYSPF